MPPQHTDPRIHLSPGKPTDSTTNAAGPQTPKPRSTSIPSPASNDPGTKPATNPELAIDPEPAPITPPPTGRIMALDVGKVRIGIALTDPIGYTAQPLLTLWRKSPADDRRSLLRLLRKHTVVEIVIGNPLHLSGDVSPWALKVHAFAADLATRSGLPLHLWDERLTSVEAHTLLDQAGHDRRNRKHLIDQVAAVLILQDWLGARQHAHARQALQQSDQQFRPQSDPPREAAGSPTTEPKNLT